MFAAFTFDRFKPFHLNRRNSSSQTQKRKKKVVYSEDERKTWLVNISKPKKVFEPEILVDLNN